MVQLGKTSADVTHCLRAPDAPQNVRFCRNPRKINFQKMREKKKLEKSFFLFSQNRTNTDEFGRNPKNKTPCFTQYEFCADGFGRVFFPHFPRISENWENCKKITDEFWGFLIFSPPFYFPYRDIRLYRFWWVGGRQPIVVADPGDANFFALLEKEASTQRTLIACVGILRAWYSIQHKNPSSQEMPRSRPDIEYNNPSS